MSRDKRAALASRMKQSALVVAPGIFDMISAKIADRLGFECLYVTGYGTVASHLGLPDAGLATYSDMVARVAQMAKLTATPLVADADTGYGGLLNVRHTVRGYEEAGASERRRTPSSRRGPQDPWSPLRCRRGACSVIPQRLLWWAATRPVPVRSRIRSRSNSAMPANTVMTMRPAAEVVSAQGSASD